MYTPYNIHHNNYYIVFIIKFYEMHEGCIGISFSHFYVVSFPDHSSPIGLVNGLFRFVPCVCKKKRM